LRRLLALNQSGLLSEDEKFELDEIETLEHLVNLLKIQALQQLGSAPGRRGKEK
jgi:hypothetical protein